MLPTQSLLKIFPYSRENMIQKTDRNYFRLTVISNRPYATYEIIFHIQNVIYNKSPDSRSKH